jgi:MFS family permease
MYSGWISAVPLLFFSLIAGSLSDVFGRKPLILYPLIGYSLTSITYIINWAFIDVLPVEFFYLGRINALFGGYAVFFLGVYAYGTSVTQPDERAYRLTRCQN